MDSAVNQWDVKLSSVSCPLPHYKFSQVWLKKLTSHKNFDYNFHLFFFFIFWSEQKIYMSISPHFLSQGL